MKPTMISKNHLQLLFPTCLLLALPLAGCAQAPLDDGVAIGESVAEINGGIDMEDEAPMFGEPVLFESAALDSEIAFSGSIGDQSEITSMEQEPGAAVVHAVVRWGQIPFNPETIAPVDWSGTLSVNRGAIIIRRVIAFEPATGDNIAPRTSRREINFSSTTKPASDGLRVTIIDPTPSSSEPLLLDYSNSEGSVFSVALTDLVDAPQELFSDEPGNRILAVAMVRPTRDADCVSGTLGGRWHKVAEDRGRLLGAVRSSEGELLGHMKGIYGQRPNGNRMVFGKYIDTEGAFRGLFIGRYQNGHFRGLWLTNAGLRGGFGGEYRASVDINAEAGGDYLGRWASSACRVSIQPAGEVPDTEVPDQG